MCVCACFLANVHLQPNHHSELMDEVKAAAAHVAVVREINAVADAAGAGDGAEDAANPLVGQLHHVVSVDKSAPVIPADAHVQTVRVPPVFVVFWHASAPYTASSMDAVDAGRQPMFTAAQANY